MTPLGLTITVVAEGGGSDSETNTTSTEPLTAVTADECTPADPSCAAKAKAPWAEDQAEEEAGGADGASGGHTKKHAWTAEEDEQLLALVTERGPSAWSQIAAHLPGRVGKQCRERWHNHLAPDVKKETFSDEEDRAIVEAVAEHGTKWSVIVKLIPGRTDNAIKNRWNSAIRKLLRMQTRKEEGCDVLGERNITAMPAQELARFLLDSGLNPRGAPPRAKRKLSVDAAGEASKKVDGLDLLSRLSAEQPATCTSPSTAAALTLAGNLGQKPPQTPLRSRSRGGGSGRSGAKRQKAESAKPDESSSQVMAAALSLLGPSLGEMPDRLNSSPRTMRAAVSLLGGFVPHAGAALHEPGLADRPS